MELAQIVPPQWVSHYVGGTYRMVLAHWVLEHPRYAQAIRDASKKPRVFIFLDNGSFEGLLVSPSKLNEACIQVGADEAVLPDVPGDARATLKASWECLGALVVDRVMFVPQATSVEEWGGCLQAWLRKWEGSYWSKERVLTIGITSLKDEAGKAVIGSRPQLITEAARLGYPFHLLGVGSPELFGTKELPLAIAGGARGVDTSTAFALGAAGKVLTTKQPKVFLKEPGAYETLPMHNRRLVRLNQRILRAWVEKGGGSETIPTELIRTTASTWLTWYSEGFCPLEDAMKACGLRGRFALTRHKEGRENHIRVLDEDGRTETEEEEINVQ